MTGRGLKTFLLAAFVLAFAPHARAEEPAWTFVEAGYLSVDPDNFSDSGDNWFAGGSIGFLKHFHGFARYINGDYSTNTDLTYWKFGAGWHGLLGDPADIVAEISWLDSEVGNVSDDGYSITGGVRWLPVKLIELDGFVTWQDLDQGGSDTGWEARAIVNIWRMGFGAAYVYSKDVDQWNVFARFNFGLR